MLVRLTNKREAHTENHFGVTFTRVHIDTSVAIRKVVQAPFDLLNYLLSLFVSFQSSLERT